jgi:DegV family protein with EDD domain
MSTVCILTDSTAQFPKPVFPGRNLIKIIPFHVRVNDLLVEGDSDVKANELPASVHAEEQPVSTPPTVDEFRETFNILNKDYNEVITILLSSHLSDAVINAQQAADQLQGRMAVQVIDSQSTSVGLGYLAQIAAEAASAQASSNEIERLLRGQIPHLYSIFCIPGLTYIHHAGFIDYAQAMVGEMLGLLPIFTLEDGHLTPLEKARNLRHLTDFFQEFLDEFSDLNQVSIVQSIPPLTHEAKILREHAVTNFPKIPFSEHPISLSLASLFGPRSLGIFAIETVNHKNK